jgi:hypothetical protein
MKTAVAILISTALFAFAIWAIVRGIEPMVARESNNRVHALLLGCTYMGKSKDFETVLYFDCDGRIELHKEIEWNTPN